MSITLPPQVFAQAIKNVYHNIPVCDAAEPQGLIGPLVCAFQKMIYELLGLELPPHLQTKPLKDMVEANKSEMLQILASITYASKDSPPAVSGRSVVLHHDQTKPFRFQEHWFQFVQEHGNFFLVQFPSGDTSDTGNARNSRWDLGTLSPKKLKSQALRALTELENSQGKVTDLTRFSLDNVDDISKFNFSHVKVSSKNLLEMSKAIASNPNLPENTMIDLRGAILAAGSSTDFPQDFSHFNIDKSQALKLIEYGVSTQKVFEQYVQSQNMLGIRGFDISCFNLAAIDFTDLDLRNANVESVISRNNPAELVALKKADTTSRVAETLRMSTSASAILSDPTPYKALPMAVDGPYQFVKPFREFLQFAFELNALHKESRTLGNIGLRTSRLHDRHVYYIDDGIQSSSVKPGLIRQFDLKPTFHNRSELERRSDRVADDRRRAYEELTGPERPQKLSPVRQDQYDFFGLLIHALTGKNELNLIPPNNRYDPEDIAVLHQNLPCDETLKAEWLEFMLNPFGVTLTHPLHKYLMEPKTEYEGWARADLVAPVQAESDPASQPALPVTAPVLQSVPATAATMPLTQSAPFRASYDVDNLFKAKREGTYQFDVAHFIQLARTQQARLTPRDKVIRGNGQNIPDRTVKVMSIQKKPLQDCIYFRGNQVRLDPEQAERNITDAASFDRIAKKIQLGFFSTMIEAGGVPDNRRSHVAYAGPEGSLVLGERWGRRTAVDFVNGLRQLPLLRKIELARFLVDPDRNELTAALETYLQPYPGLTIHVMISENDVTDRVAPGASSSLETPVASQAAEKSLPSADILPPPESMYVNSVMNTVKSGTKVDVNKSAVTGSNGSSVLQQLGADSPLTIEKVQLNRPESPWFSWVQNLFGFNKPTVDNRREEVL